MQIKNAYHRMVSQETFPVGAEVSLTSRNQPKTPQISIII
jgi:hypothetical protein